MLKCAEVRSGICRNNQECSGAYDLGVFPNGLCEDSCNGFAVFIVKLCRLRTLFLFLLVGTIQVSEWKFKGPNT